MNFILIITIMILFYTLYRYKRRRLYELAALIPSMPEKVPFIGALGYCTPDLKNKMVKLIKVISLNCQNCGGVLKFWVGHLLFIVITNPEDAEFVLKNCLEKADIVKFLRNVIGNAGIFAKVSIWTRRRKILIPAFSPKILNSFMENIINQSNELAEQLSKKNMVGTGEFHLWPFISSYTLDSVCETALGIRFHYLENPENQFIKATEKLFSLVSDRIFKIWLWPDWVYKWFSHEQEFQKNLKIVYELTDQIIQKKREELKDVDIKLENSELVFGLSPKKVNCFLEHLILLSSNGSGLTNLEIREEVMTFIMAGTDTSSITICNTLTLLGKYPKIQEKVYQEILDVLGTGNNTVEKDDLKKFVYLERVLKESLRLFPPAPLLVRKTTEEVSLPSGRIVPADTEIVLSVWGISRDKKYWGPDADCFDPDRFLPDRKTGFFMPFSSGPRNCIGYQYAFMSMKLALIAVLRRYRVIGKEEKGPEPDIDVSFRLMMKDTNGYPLSLEVR